LSAVSIGYTYGGYVSWLWIRSHLRPRPALRGWYEPSISIVMVVRNEEKVLRAKLDNLLGLDYPKQSYEVVVVWMGRWMEPKRFFGIARIPGCARC